MKLWHKIFLCMFLLSLCSVGIYGSTSIRRTHLENLEWEMERSSGEMDLLSEAVSGAVKMLGNLEEAVGWYAGYYKPKGIYFALYEDGKQSYASVEGIPESVYTSMLDVKDNEKMMFVRRQENHDYFLVSGMLEEKKILFYIREITGLYDMRAQKQRTFGFWMLGFSAVMALASYLVAKLLTKPLARLKKNAECVNDGVYLVQCKEGKDEIGSLGSAFNAMAKAVEEREQSLRNESEKKQQFIDAMTHEMNTPLTSILGYAQFLRNANCTPAQRELALGCIEAEAKRMHGMYQKLRALQMAGSEGIIKERVFVAPALNEVKQELAALLAEKKIVIRENLQIEYLETDGVLLHMVLSNLIRNSVNYSSEGGVVAVAFSESDFGGCVLSVQDFGCGIPRECVDKVTEPYYRVDKSRSRATGGSGIGLYLCREIMRRFGGRLEISSEEGKGTTVSLVFPKESFTQKEENLQA